MNALKPALPRRRRSRQLQDLRWMGPHQHEQGIDQAIGLDQGAVEINARAVGAELSGASGEETALVLDWGKDHLIEKHSKYTVG